MSDTSMQRRSFFKLVGAGAVVAAGAGLSGCSIPGAPTQDPVNKPAFQVQNDPAVAFASEVDVLVVGSGIAGLSAAMAPAEAGLSVMVADKLELLGGESFSANGLMRVSGTELQQKAGIATTALEAWDARKQELADAGTSDLDFAKRLFLEAPSWVDHLMSTYKSEFSDPASYVSTGAPNTIVLPKKGLGDMESVMAPLRNGLSEKGVTFSTGMRAVAFIIDEESVVSGVRFVVEKTRAITDVGARRVVMATGSYASSQPLIHAYVPSQEHVSCYTYASMGEGHTLCASVGGQLSDMDKPGNLISDIPKAASWGVFGPTLVVSPAGKRFAREDDTNAPADACHREELGFWWTIFSRQLSDGVQARSVAQTVSKHVKRLVGPCDSIESLATELSVSAEELKLTFEKYDEAVAAQKDEAFGRTLFLQNIEPPYYALRQFPSRYKTRGGVKVDGDGRLLNAAGSPVGQVYCCGSVGASSVEGLVSNGTFGMLVGQAITKVLTANTKNSGDSNEAS